MSRDPKEIVETGYNALSHLYRKDDEVPENYLKWIDLMKSLIPPPPSEILDIGCGCGVPVAQMLSEAGYAVTGIDLSLVQIERAKRLVPKGTFVHADITSTTLLPQARFVGILALYVLIHIPIEEQPSLIKRIGTWLDQDGHCIMIVGITPWMGEIDGWRGAEKNVKMWWQQAGLQDYRKWANEAGLDVINEEFIPEDPGEGHQLLVLKKRRGN
ncbi:S-adenosyl-L-methionine-dependent methyltransferase [Mycena floridula]|nr:S-adenosyl-L-methionine-dependent methyltransferase [Mycena floridula]